MSIGAFIVYIVLEVFEAEIGFLVIANDLQDTFRPPLQGGCYGKSTSHKMGFTTGVPEATDAAFGSLKKKSLGAKAVSLVPMLKLKEPSRIFLKPASTIDSGVWVKL